VQSSAATTPPARLTRATTPAPVVPRINPWAALLAVGESLLSLGLAIYLLVIGILVFRGSHAGARQHRIYALIKIPLALLAGVASGWMYFGFVSSMPFSTRGIGVFFVVFAIVAAVISMAYPIGLLIALQSRSVRGYYAQGRT
jgi:hypothetical protein